MIRLDVFAAILRRATLLFLALPLVIFFAGWLRVPLAVLTCGAVGAAVWRSWREARRPAPADATATISWRTLLWAVGVPAAVLTLLSGAGGWGAGDSDWLKHDTLLRDLLTHSWPVTYESGQGPVLLVYYVAFYLPAASLGKLAGGDWNVASQTLALTLWLGVVLSASWLVVLGSGSVRRPAAPVIAAAVFFGFSGLDAFGKVLVNLFLRLPVFYGDWSDVSWWAQFAQYSANAASLFWAPQHAFGGWLPMALALDDWFHGGRLERCGAWYAALALAWSPLAAVGLLPLVGGMILWGWWREAGGRTSSMIRMATRRWVTLENVAGVLAGGVFALYLAAHFQSYPIPAAYRIVGGHHPMPLLEEAHVPFVALYAVFVGLEFAGLALALAWFYGVRGGGWEEHRTRPLLALAVGVLLALPWGRYGFANDLVMRGGIPALFVLQVLLARMFATRPSVDPVTRRQRVAVLLAAGLLAGGLVNVSLEYRRHVMRMVAQGSWRDARTRGPVRTLAELQRTIYARPGFDFARQYLGAADSPFGRYAAARRGALSPEAARVQPDF